MSGWPKNFVFTNTIQFYLTRSSFFCPETNSLTFSRWCHKCKDDFFNTDILWRTSISALLIEYSEISLPVENSREPLKIPGKSHILTYMETLLFRKLKEIPSNLNEHLSSLWKQKCLPANKWVKYLPNRSFNLQMLENKWRSKAFLQTAFPSGRHLSMLRISII